jgi:hypothetical protein
MLKIKISIFLLKKTYCICCFSKLLLNKWFNSSSCSYMASIQVVQSHGNITTGKFAIIGGKPTEPLPEFALYRVGTLFNFIIRDQIWWKSNNYANMTCCDVTCKVNGKRQSTSLRKVRASFTYWHVGIYPLSQTRKRASVVTYFPKGCCTQYFIEQVSSTA